MNPSDKIERPEDVRELLDKRGLEDVPVFAMPPGHRSPTTAEHFFTNCSWVLQLQGFKIQKIDNDFVIKHGQDPRVLITAPTINDLMLLLVVTGAWAGVEGRKIENIQP